MAERHRSRPDPELARRLIDLRRAGAAEAASSHGRDPWPPAYDDPFPGQAPGTLPEADAHDLRAPVVLGAVRHHGSVVVRGLFSAEQVERTVDAIKRVGEERAAEGTRPLDRGIYRPYPDVTPDDRILRTIVAGHGGTWLADSPLTTAQVLDDLAAVGVVDLAREHFGERPCFSLQKSTLRRSAPVHDFAGWHQDGSFLGPEVRTMNVWVALSDCGGDRPTPGLELVPRRVDELLPTDGGLGSASISDARVLEAAGELGLARPEFDAGDALVFDERFVHRTHLTPHMTYERFALECWLFAPSHAAQEYVPFLI